MLKAFRCTQSEAVFILENKRKMECIEGIPVIHTWEMDEIENCREFFVF